MQSEDLTTKTNHVFKQFQENAPNSSSSNTGEFYDSLDPEAYLRWKEEI